MFKNTSVACLAVVAALSGAPASTLAPIADAPVHPAPQNAIQIPVSGMTVWDLICGLEADTDTRFVVDDGIREFLAESHLAFSQVVDVPPDSRWSVAETFVAEQGGSFELLRGTGPRLIAIRMAPHQTGFRSRFVDSDDLDRFSEHPASQIMTVLEAPNTDVRNLSNSLRVLTLDPNQLSIVAAGNSDSIVVRGRASAVLEAVRMIRAIDSPDAAKGSAEWWSGSTTSGGK